MKVELLYFEGCPSYRVAEERLRNVLRATGIEAQVELVRVDSDEEAQKLAFPGSPTLRIDGSDLFLTEAAAGLGCRVYTTPEGLSGAPTTELLERALRDRI